jgi:hypothetical protein
MGRRMWRFAPVKTCAVCNHPCRAEIDRLLVEKVSLRDIAGQTGTTRSALHRHSQHLPGALVAAKDAEKVADAGTLLTRAQGLMKRATDILDKAERAGKLETALTAIRELRGCMELLGKLSGELKAAQVNNVAIAGAVTDSERRGGEMGDQERRDFLMKILGVEAADIEAIRREGKRSILPWFQGDDLARWRAMKNPNHKVI